MGRKLEDGVKTLAFTPFFHSHHVHNLLERERRNYKGVKYRAWLWVEDGRKEHNYYICIKIKLRIDLDISWLILFIYLFIFS